MSELFGFPSPETYPHEKGDVVRHVDVVRRVEADNMVPSAQNELAKRRCEKNARKKEEHLRAGSVHPNKHARTADVEAEVAVSEAAVAK